jgi:hypothetical protein
MSLEALATDLDGVTLGEAIWLFPVAFALHVCEEWPRFPAWAQRHASAAFTRREYVAIHLVGLLTALLVPILWHLFPLRWVAFVLFAVVLIPSMGWNAVFHAGATVASRTYCPGLITALALYLPLVSTLGCLALREDVLSAGTLLGAVGVAGVFHAAEVGHNVYKAW